MRSKTLFIGLRAALAIFAVTLSVTSTWAATSWNEKVLHSFSNNGTDGGNPYAGLISDAAGNLYGTTLGGGTYGYGMVFELTPTGGGGWTEQVLHSFNPYNGTDGCWLYAGLIFDGGGNLYGTTMECGANGGGTVFELSPGEGGWTEAVLYSFSNSGTDGYLPYAGLIFDAAGNLYGTTLGGGTYGYGTVFKLTPAGTETVLHSFNNNGTDGYLPYAGLIFDAAGNLYGATREGGAYDQGTVFKLSPGNPWTETVLHSFGNGTDGAQAYSGLIFDAAGNLYGTNLEAAFELTPSGGGNWTLTVLHNFGNGTDGYLAQGGLIFDAAGKLYGTTSEGGSYNSGTVFELTPERGGGWTETVLHSFGNGTDGTNPYDSLIFDAAGNLYGTTTQGGSSGYGTVFELSPVYPCATCSHSADREVNVLPAEKRDVREQQR